jgi:hypothetical protein
MKALKNKITLLFSLFLIIVIFFNTKKHDLTFLEKKELSINFKFEQKNINNLKTTNIIRKVHPSLDKISSWISSVGASVCLCDLDGDGLPNDLCLIDPRLDKVLIRPVPGTGDRYKEFFLEIPSYIQFDQTMAPTGCLSGDFDEDGKIDLMIYFWGRTPIIFYNKSTKRKIMFHPKELCANEKWYTNCATAADFDGDGHVDILVCNYFKDGAEILNTLSTKPQSMHDSKSHSYNGGGTYFFLWSESGFKKKSEVLNNEIKHGWTLAVGAADLNGDLLPEIYLSQDFGPDRLLLNNSKPGNLSFELLKGKKSWLKPKSFVLGMDSFKGMGCDFADINNDGILDIFISNITSEWALQESNLLWLSQADKLEEIKKGIAPYTQSSEEFGVSRSGWGWDAKFADLNNDGELEILVATGFVKGNKPGWALLQALASGNDNMLSNPSNWPKFKPGIDLSGHELTSFFVKKNKKYYNLAEFVGLDNPMVTRGIAVADVDGDGDLDFVLANQWENSLFFENKSSNNNKSVIINPLIAGDTENVTVKNTYFQTPKNCRPAIGFQAKLNIDNKVLVQQVDGGNGHSGKRSPQIHFGLKDFEKEFLKVEISWIGNKGSFWKKEVELSPGWNTLILGDK